MKEVLISVIVPVYNAEQYIKNCVQSIQNQTCSDFELILINDGSTDSSLNICKNLAEEDKRIKVINQVNAGASAARNTGLKHVTGKYVVFVDSDDYVSPYYLENLYLAAQVGNYELVQCNFESTNLIDSKLPDVCFSEKHVHEITKTQALNNRIYKVTVWGKIYSTKILQEIQFQEGIIYEDDASYYIFIDRANRIAVLDETLYYYYMSDNSVMRNLNKDKSTAFLKIYEDRIEYFKERNDKELLEGTYDRYCLVLMLTLSASYSHNTNVVDRPKMLQQFKKYYSLVMKSASISVKDKVMFTCFWISPPIIGRIIGILNG